MRSRSLAARGPTPAAWIVVLAVAVPDLSSSCAKPAGHAPVELTDAASVDPEVLALVRSKVEFVRAAPADARRHGSLGLVYSANDLWSVAQGEFAIAAELEPRNALWRYHRAIALREAGDVEAARALLAGAAAELPNVAGVQQRLGSWALELGDHATAEAALQRALASMPEQPDVLVGLANVRIAREDWAGALEYAQRALKKEPGFKPARYASGLALRGLGRGAEAESELTAGVGSKLRWIEDPLGAEERSYRVNYVAQFADASQRMLAGQHATALPTFERLAKKRPDDVDVLGNLAACLQETGNPTRAVEVLLHALELDPKAFATHLNLSDAYLRLGRVEDGLKHSQRACELAPDLGRAHLARARALMLHGDLEPAYQALRESARLDPNNPTTYVALFEVCTRLKRGGEALAWCRRSVELAPSHVPSRVNLAQGLLSSGDLDGARAQIAELLRLAPQNERVLALKRELEARTR